MLKKNKTEGLSSRKQRITKEVNSFIQTPLIETQNNQNFPVPSEKKNAQQYKEEIELNALGQSHEFSDNGNYLNFTLNVKQEKNQMYDRKTSRKMYYFLVGIVLLPFILNSLESVLSPYRYFIMFFIILLLFGILPIFTLYYLYKNHRKRKKIAANKLLSYRFDRDANYFTVGAQYMIERISSKNNKNQQRNLSTTLLKTDNLRRQPSALKIEKYDYLYENIKEINLRKEPLESMFQLKRIMRNGKNFIVNQSNDKEALLKQAKRINEIVRVNVILD